MQMRITSTVTEPIESPAKEEPQILSNLHMGGNLSSVFRIHSPLESFTTLAPGGWVVVGVPEVVIEGVFGVIM